MSDADNFSRIGRLIEDAIHLLQRLELPPCELESPLTLLVAASESAEALGRPAAPAPAFDATALP